MLVYSFFLLRKYAFVFNFLCVVCVDFGLMYGETTTKKKGKQSQYVFHSLCAVCMDFCTAHMMYVWTWICEPECLCLIFMANVDIV